MLELWYEAEIIALWIDIKIEDDPSYDSRIKITYVNGFFSALFSVWKNRDAIIYANSFILPSLLAWIIWRNTIFFSHDPVLPTKYSRFYFFKKIFVKFCYRFFTKIRVINDYEKQWLEDEGIKGKWVVIPLVVSMEVMLPPKWNDWLLMLWHLVPKKWINTILDALEIVKLKFPDFKVIQIGDLNLFSDEKWNWFEVTIKNRGLTDNFVLHSKVKKSLIPELVKDASIYINSSYMEWQCLAVYDAITLWFAVCLPNITSFQWVFPESALYHDPWDSKSLAENIITYLKNKDLREKHILINQKIIKSKYSYEYITRLIQKEFPI